MTSNKSVETSNPALLKWFEQKEINYTLLFLISLVVLFLRSAYLITNPFFYAEDSSWISSIFKDGFFHALLFSKRDYFVFGNIILLQIANLLNSLLNGDDINNLPHFMILSQPSWNFGNHRKARDIF